MTKEQWLAVRNSDASYDGMFYYGIRGSGRVCRPSCRKRSYDPKRIIIFDSLQDALAQGRVPCSRCHPEQERREDPKTQLAHAAGELVKACHTEKFSLTSLAEALHVDRSYLARTFKAVTGLTLLQYHNLVRCGAAKELLTRPELSISYIASSVGYVSPSHFTQIFRKIVGKTPSQYRDDYLRSLTEPDQS